MRKYRTMNDGFGFLLFSLIHLELIRRGRCELILVRLASGPLFDSRNVTRGRKGKNPRCLLPPAQCA